MAKKHFADAAKTGVEALLFATQEKKPVENAPVSTDLPEVKDITPPKLPEAEQKKEAGALNLVINDEGETPTEVRIAQLLDATFTAAGTDTIRIHLNDIAQELGISYMTVQRLKKVLETKGKYKFARKTKCTEVIRM